MSPLKSLVAGLAIFSAATAVQAQVSATATIVRITGSTAYRGATHTAIRNVFDTAPSPVVYGYTGSSLSSASQAIFSGKISGNDVIVETGWSGSVGGVQTVAGGLPVNFLADTLADGSSLTTGGTASLATGTNSKVPDVAMSDTFQNSTPFTSPTLVSTKVGVVPFKWVVSRGLTPVVMNVDTTSGSNVATVADTSSLSAGMTISGNTNIVAATTGIKIGAIINATTFTIVKNTDGTNQNASTTAAGVATTFVAPSPITNITPQLAQVLYQNGSCELALFTGNSADIGKKVWSIGRDPDSGTRLTAFAEAGVGVNSTVVQYQPTVSGGAVVSQVPYPSATINGILIATGNNGYASGGTLAGVMGNSTSAINGYYVTYLSTGDATTAINAGAKEISYNGVPYSLTAVQQGLYTFWSYEHLMYQSSILPAKKSVADAIANRIITTDGTILLSTMKVVRQSDGGNVTQNY